jgi:AraC family transcriptional regulator, regulatory protein of adaptative response / methylated-DNA-[protein]-cysteine methyltransferase
MVTPDAQMLTWSVTDTSIGAVIGVASQRGLCRVLIGRDQQAVTAELLAAFPRAQLTRDDPAMKKTMQALGAITRGKDVADLATDVTGTPFQTKVWHALSNIPKGATRSYADVAKAIGKPRAARAVASACASNPIALVVPCHRVIHSDGTVSGYAWGIDVKEALLDAEGGQWRGSR